MKAFLGAIVGAVVSGLVLFFAQAWWTESQTEQTQRVRFDEQATVTLSREKLVELSRAGSEYATPSVHIFQTENTGTEDIADKTFSVAIPDVIAFENIDTPNKNPQNVNITYDDNVLTVNYRLLPAESKHLFWFASESSYLSSDFANDTTGVYVETERDKYVDQDPFPWGWFGAAGACLIALIVGAGVNESYITQRLAKRGHNFSSLMGLKDPSDTPSAPTS